MFCACNMADDGKVADSTSSMERIMQDRLVIKSGEYSKQDTGVRPICKSACTLSCYDSLQRAHHAQWPVWQILLLVSALI